MGMDTTTGLPGVAAMLPVALTAFAVMSAGAFTLLWGCLAMAGRQDELEEHALLRSRPQATRS